MGNVGVNLSSTNADTLDGKHVSDFVRRYSALLPVDYHGFVFGLTNTPFWYCFLDVS